ncbi:AbrB/MazE/SpoVT family DNA-binding domain-containing protein [Xanthobacter sp. AM11]|jgi:putative addiction module antidote|uniref:AbrB/MazE/SpoVT family DNA-binding domain-containing protein n=1 Tax=Xanthobacter sp. AM11 TaxID=3380643 RepID=UPI0039BF5EF9
MVALKLGKIGNSVGAVLPKEVLARLKVEQGDTLYLTETPDGYHLTPYEPEFEAQMEAARKIMKKRRNVLRELAK